MDDLTPKRRLVKAVNLSDLGLIPEISDGALREIEAHRQRELDLITNGEIT